jgi:hypothetical protein
VAALGRKPNSGLIVAPETFTTTNRELFIALAERHKVPAIYGLNQMTRLAPTLQELITTEDRIKIVCEQKRD